ncbi:MAG: iron-sulfur cluster assembly scaffold protein [Rhodocyclales bacterium CG17_big_fil_post_rev_8_21_14_2_50_68_7]|nr:MAG: hypothetical protein AUK49_01475 [Betaproteobacteria bacterium CG2_30_68_42]PIV71566.1 MAG: iron-sulfur cluster assembly scaffold protein [Rhodocyclales bacterium CG17_big_fil_post_rev_8_21_14_2_50_68_7]PIX75573.1 MAG: iron-sulfur cluster assembly scaffold protein [Rhodocyclales bacterium CG_4_10_14_3_um_filter_68_10]PJA58234.1 MAG: iron-sulfur cluster assembly scaffold protein [Rhodocyclales bacterium CG_4_9_14_3_um_filter_68_10]
MSDSIYQEAIKTLAQAAHGAGTLEAATGEARLDNPLCGDRVRVQLRIEGGRIAALAHEVRGCLLCRAAAAALGLRAPGSSAEELEAAAAALARLLETGEPPAGLWRELAAFAPVHAHPGRHACVRLPFDAAIEALSRAAAGSG